jgi:hypothetical protein
VRRALGTTLAIALMCLLAGCGEEKVKLPAPAPSVSTRPSPSSSAATFAMPSPGDAIGGTVAARPPDQQTAEGASAFAAWMLSLLLHTPRENTSTAAWTQAAGAGCDACRNAAGVWQEQQSKGQVFRYARTPQFVRTVVRAQKQGDGWFVELEAAVPRSTLSKGGRVLQSVDAEHLDYTFTLAWVDDAWRLQDFHVLG